MRTVSLFGVCLIATGVQAADKPYCDLYSREMTRSYARSLDDATRVNTTKEALSFVMLKYWSACLNQDEEPVIKTLPTDEQFIAMLWTTLQGTEPATAAPAPAIPADPVRIKPDAPASLSPAQICANAHRRIVWKNKFSWRCK